MTFSDLGLSPETLKAIEEVGYVIPTPIQEQAIPWVLQGRDVLGIAQTGTGKTASFTLPMIEILANGRAKARMPRSLILAPTRELANQVSENFTLYGKYHKLSMALLIGGESFTEQEKALDRGVDVLIATPGRLLDLFDRGRIILRDVKVLVIDEADRMLDMGFIPDVEKIVSKLPPLRQTLFFSATMDNQIKRLADAFLQNPKEIRVASKNSTAVTVSQHLVHVDVFDKREALRHIIRMEDVKNAFIFCNRKRDVGVLHRSLQKHGFDVCQFHGDMPQSERQATLNAFKAGSVRLMVCSDVAARGIDIADVSHVFNFDVPIHAEDYVHRIGRTGRAGKEGKAYTIASPEDSRHLAAVEKLLGKPIPVITLEGLVSKRNDGDSTESTDESRSGEGRNGEGRGRRDRGRNRGRRDSRPSDAVETVTEVTEGVDVPDSTAVEPVAAPAAAEERSGDSRPPRQERSRYDRPREDRPREDRPREDRPREDRSSREDRSRDDRYGRNSNGNKGRRDHPARDVESMNYGDDVLAFGGYTPAFMLVETTQYSGPLADLPEGYEEEEEILAPVETVVEDIAEIEPVEVLAVDEIISDAPDAEPAAVEEVVAEEIVVTEIVADSVVDVADIVVAEAAPVIDAVIVESAPVEAVTTAEPAAEETAAKPRRPRRRRTAESSETAAPEAAAADAAPTPEAVTEETAKPAKRPRKRTVKAAEAEPAAEAAPVEAEAPAPTPRRRTTRKKADAATAEAPSADADSAS